VSTNVCASGSASLFDVKGDGTDASYVDANGCQFWYFAEWHCTEPEIIDHGRSCRKQVKNLGEFSTANDCALAVQGDTECTQKVFMWSESYHSWGCRCCESQDNPREHELWNLYAITGENSCEGLSDISFECELFLEHDGNYCNNQQNSQYCEHTCCLKGLEAPSNGEEYCESGQLTSTQCQASTCCHWNDWEEGEASNYGTGRCWSSIGTDICLHQPQGGSECMAEMMNITTQENAQAFCQGDCVSSLDSHTAEMICSTDNDGTYCMPLFTIFEDMEENTTQIPNSHQLDVLCSPCGEMMRAMHNSTDELDICLELDGEKCFARLMEMNAMVESIMLQGQDLMDFVNDPIICHKCVRAYVDEGAFDEMHQELWNGVCSGSPTLNPPPGCVDTPGWTDNWGDGCSWYNADERCSAWGHHGAGTHCCRCGGGSSS